jgi:casein kinase II subunit alpha
LVNSSNEELVDEKAFDLLTRMLTINHIDRATATEALLHPYFESIRSQAMEQENELRT